MENTIYNTHFNKTIIIDINQYTKHKHTPLAVQIPNHCPKLLCNNHKHTKIYHTINNLYITHNTITNTKSVQNTHQLQLFAQATILPSKCQIHKYQSAHNIYIFSNTIINTHKIKIYIKIKKTIKPITSIPHDGGSVAKSRRRRVAAEYSVGVDGRSEALRRKKM